MFAEENQPTALTAADAAATQTEYVWRIGEEEEEETSGGLSLSLSLHLSPSLSDEIVFKWSCARNDDRRRNDDDDDANDPEEGKFDFALWGWPSGWLPESG